MPHPPEREPQWGTMPRIWDDTVAGHKDKLRRTIVDAAVALVD